MTAEATLVRAWHDALGNSRISVNALIREFGGDGGLYRTLGQVGGNPDGTLNPRKIGTFSVRIEGHVIEGFRFVRAGVRRGYLMWRLDPESKGLILYRRISSYNTKKLHINQQNHHERSSDHPSGDGLPGKCVTCRYHQFLSGSWLVGLCSLTRRAAVAVCENHATLEAEGTR